MPLNYRGITNRLTHANSLLCNVGLKVSCQHTMVDLHKQGPLVWFLQSFEGETLLITRVYKHERSMMRAAWRLYRAKTED